ncbi:hypothetical protein ES708_23341 [subsurface metagenome]
MLKIKNTGNGIYAKLCDGGIFLKVSSFTQYLSYFSFFCSSNFIFFSNKEPQYKKAIPTKKTPKPAKKRPKLTKLPIFSPFFLKKISLSNGFYLKISVLNGPYTNYL